eukprot:IDg15746t1
MVNASIEESRDVDSSDEFLSRVMSPEYFENETTEKWITNSLVGFELSHTEYNESGAMRDVEIIAYGHILLECQGGQFAIGKASHIELFGNSVNENVVVGTGMSAEGCAMRLKERCSEDIDLRIFIRFADGALSSSH